MSLLDELRKKKNQILGDVSNVVKSGFDNFRNTPASQPNLFQQANTYQQTGRLPQPSGKEGLGGFLGPNAVARDQVLRDYKFTPASAVMLAQTPLTYNIGGNDTQALRSGNALGVFRPDNSFTGGSISVNNTNDFTRNQTLAHEYVHNMDRFNTPVQKQTFDNQLNNQLQTNPKLKSWLQTRTSGYNVNSNPAEAYAYIPTEKPGQAHNFPGSYNYFNPMAGAVANLKRGQQMMKTGTAQNKIVNRVLGKLGNPYIPGLDY